MQVPYPCLLPTLVLELDPSFWITLVALALKVEFGTVQIMALVFITVVIPEMSVSDAKVSVK